jgi:CRP/FNR family transcriptional regulator, cyclic AMP receptor protein
VETSVKDKIASFFQTFKQQTYKKGEILIRADEEPSGIFYLKEGFIKEYIISQKGDELVVNIFKPGAFFPMSFAVNNTSNSFYFEATTPLEVYKAPTDKAVTFLKDNPDVMFDLLRRVYVGTDGLLLRMAYLMSGNASERLITELIIHAKRFGRHKPAPSSGEVELALSETELATRTGLSRETVSREFKQLKERGLAIFSQGVITIPSLSKLEAELE